jgi:hypothetical protein
MDHVAVPSVMNAKEEQLKEKKKLTFKRKKKVAEKQSRKMMKGVRVITSVYSELSQGREDKKRGAEKERIMWKRQNQMSLLHGKSNKLVAQIYLVGLGSDYGEILRQV